MRNTKVNRIIKYLIYSDLVFWFGWGLISPVFAIFITEEIQGGSPLVVGIAAAVYALLSAVLRIPIGIFLDSRPSEKDDYWFLVIGLFIAAVVSFGFLFTKFPWHIYLLQALRGIGIAMSLAGWSAIFTKHIDKGKEATEWGLDATSVGIGIGISGAIGGWAVTQFGFNPVFIAVGVFGLIGVAVLFGLNKEITGVFDHGFHFSLKEIFKKEEK